MYVNMCKQQSKTECDNGMHVKRQRITTNEHNHDYNSLIRVNPSPMSADKIEKIKINLNIDNLKLYFRDIKNLYNSFAPPITSCL